MLLAITLGPVASEIVLIAAILLVLFVIFKLGNLILGLILNSILGLLAIYLVNYLFSLGIVYNILTIIVVAITGVPGAAVIILLKLIGISI
jgi:hypothetical protein